jgi:hypothetical protein
MASYSLGATDIYRRQVGTTRVQRRGSVTTSIRTYVNVQQLQFYHDSFAVDSIFRTSSIQHSKSCTLTYRSKQMCRLVSATFSNIWHRGRPESKDVGDYKTTLQYTQHSVPTSTDQTLNLLLPILAQPIVQKIVSGTTLGWAHWQSSLVPDTDRRIHSVNNVLITNPTANSFGTKLSGSITQAGPCKPIY